MPDPTAAVRLLRRLRQDDGGFAPSAGGASEPEPTALAALALADPDAREWLRAAQRDDGSLIVGPEPVLNDTSTALAAIAMDGEARERAVDYLVGHQAQPLGFDDRFPHDPATRGWGWTSKTFGWAEPTARAVLALKLLRPSTPVVADGVAVLEDRECSVGGWNYGNPEVLGRKLEPYLQTSAAGLMAVHDGPVELRDRAVVAVERLWPDERGGLGWAMSLVALRLAGGDPAPLAAELETLVAESELLDDGVALAWAVLGLGDGWRQLRISP